MSTTKISQLPSDSNPSTTDYVPALDTETTSTRKVTLANILSLFFNNVPVSSIKPENLLAGTGTTWVWQSYTPTFTNLTVGNGTLNATYVVIGKTVIVRFYLLFGSTTSISGGVTATLPVTAAAIYGTSNWTAIGTVNYVDEGTVVYGGHFTINSSTTSFVFALSDTASTYLKTNSGLSSTVPHTWTTNDKIAGFLIYEAA